MKHIKTINKANLKKACERTHALLKGHFYVPLFLYKFVYEYKCER